MEKVSAVAAYLANQIMQDKVEYKNVEKKQPQYIDEIDRVLKENNCLEKYKTV